jgi:AraC-like DNA-binding protein
MLVPVLAGDHRICGSDAGVFSAAREFLSFLAMIEDLGLRAGIDGRVVRHAAGDLRPRAHRHAELEADLVVRGTAFYLLGERRYELIPGTLTWLFPGQEHVLVDESPDHALWWAVFRPSLVARTATSPGAQLLLEGDPIGRYSRRLDPQRAARLAALLRELHEAESLDDGLFNVGLSYLLLGAWRAFLDSDDVVGGVDVHPAVDQVARLMHADPDSGSLADLARTVGLSAPHLSRLFNTQMGLSITRFRNRQRLQRFVRLYGNGRRTTALAAAHEAGFGSYAQFYRVFRQETGRNPGVLRTAAADDQASLIAPPDRQPSRRRRPHPLTHQRDANAADAAVDRSPASDHERSAAPVA